MTDQKIALLKALALRPSGSIAPNAQPILSELVRAGYVVLGPAGWIATAEGCEAIKRNRASQPGPRAVL